MGTAVSKGANDFLVKFADAPSLGASAALEDLALQDGMLALDGPFAASIGTTSGAANSSLDVRPEQLFDALFLHTVENNRIGTALRFAATALDAAVSNTSAGAPYTSSSVRFAQLLISASIARANGGVYLLKKMVNANGEADKLHTLATDFVVKVPVTADTLRLHAEVLLLLHTFYSTPLYHPALDDDHEPDYFLDRFVLHSDPAHVRAVCRALLHRVTLWAGSLLGASMVTYPNGYQPAWSNLYNMFGWRHRDRRIDVADVVGLRTVQVLLCLLTFNKPSHQVRGVANLAVAAFQQLLGSGANDDLTVQSLVIAVARKADQYSEMLLLLYQLLVHHGGAVTDVLAKEFTPAAVAVQPVAAPMLTALAHKGYDCVATSGIAPLSFTVGTVLLLLTRSGQVISPWFAQPTQAPWYEERYLGSVTAGSLVVTVAARTVARAAALGNHDMAELFLGVLANMAPFACKLHVVAAQRIVTMLRHLLKRYAKAREATEADPDDFHAVDAQAMYEGHCATAIDAVLALLDGSDRDNVSVTYDLLHHRQDIASFAAAAPPGTRLGDAVERLNKLTSHYESELASLSVNHTVEDIMGVIRTVSAETSVPTIVSGTDRAPSSPTAHAMASCEETVYEYEEDPAAFEYFAPLVWRMALSRGSGAAVVPGPQLIQTLKLLAVDEGRTEEPVVDAREGAAAA